MSTETQPTTPETPGRRALRALLLTPVHLLGHFVALLAVSVFLVRIVPFFLAVYEDADVLLPPVTIWVIELSHFFVDYWYLFLLALLFLDAPLLLALNWLPERRRWIARVWFSLVLVAALMFLFCGGFAATIPMAVWMREEPLRP
jgi:type II secretory pathway component PulF